MRRQPGRIYYEDGSVEDLEGHVFYEEDEEEAGDEQIYEAWEEEAEEEI